MTTTAIKRNGHVWETRLHSEFGHVGPQAWQSDVGVGLSTLKQSPMLGICNEACGEAAEIQTFVESQVHKLPQNLASVLSARAQVKVTSPRLSFAKKDHGSNEEKVTNEQQRERRQAEDNC